MPRALISGCLLCGKELTVRERGLRLKIGPVHIRADLQRCEARTGKGGLCLFGVETWHDFFLGWAWIGIFLVVSLIGGSLVDYVKREEVSVFVGLYLSLLEGFGIGRGRVARIGDFDVDLFSSPTSRGERACGCYLWQFWHRPGFWRWRTHSHCWRVSFWISAAAGCPRPLQTARSSAWTPLIILPSVTWLGIPPTKILRASSINFSGFLFLVWSLARLKEILRSLNTWCLFSTSITASSSWKVTKAYSSFLAA